MLIAKVVGVAVSTVKDDRLDGAKLLLVSEADPTGKVTGKPFIALDRGSSARVAAGDVNTPVDAAIVGILDSLRHDSKPTYRKS